MLAFHHLRIPCASDTIQPGATCFAISSLSVIQYHELIIPESESFVLATSSSRGLAAREAPRSFPSQFLEFVYSRATLGLPPPSRIALLELRETTTSKISPRATAKKLSLPSGNFFPSTPGSGERPRDVPRLWITARRSECTPWFLRADSREEFFCT